MPGTGQKPLATLHATSVRQVGRRVARTQPDYLYVPIPVGGYLHADGSHVLTQSTQLRSESTRGSRQPRRAHER
jgi:hypothetical protein